MTDNNNLVLLSKYLKQNPECLEQDFSEYEEDFFDFCKVECDSINNWYDEQPDAREDDFISDMKYQRSLL